MKNRDITVKLDRTEDKIFDEVQVGEKNSGLQRIFLTDKNKKYIIPSGLTATLQWDKPDGTTSLPTLNIDLVNNCLTYEYDDNMTARSGICSAKINLYTPETAEVDGGLIRSTKFKIEVKGGMVDEDKIESSDDFSALTDALGSVKQIKIDGEQLLIDGNEMVDIGNSVIADMTELEATVSTNEVVRQTNESNRQTKEVARNSSEDTRAQQEIDREASTNTAIANAETATQSAINAANLVNSKVGMPNGIATLDDQGKVPATQLPSYVDDILDGALVNSTTFNDVNGNTFTPESGKIYIDTITNLQYRWGGSSYVIMSSALALGETSSTAYAGDKGKATADSLNAHIGSTGDSHGVATPSTDGFMSSTDKSRVDNFYIPKEVGKTLYASGWVGDVAPYTIAITFTELSTYNNGTISLPNTATPEQINSVIEADIEDLTVSGNTVTITANGEVPSIDIPVVFTFHGSMAVQEVPVFVGNGNNANMVTYDNTVSGLSSGLVQDAIDELVDKKLSNTNIVNNLETIEEGFALDARQGKVINDNLANLIQSGSNANGEWVKFADGTMICTYNGTVNNISVDVAYGSLFSGNIVWTYPQEFYETPIPTASKVKIGSSGSWATTSDASNIAATFRILDVVTRGTGNTVAVSLQAIGRWK